MDSDVYKNAKSTRPPWANALIIAAVALLVAFVGLLADGFGPLFWLMLAVTGVSLVMAAIFALLKVRRSA